MELCCPVLASAGAITIGTMTKVTVTELWIGNPPCFSFAECRACFDFLSECSGWDLDCGGPLLQDPWDRCCESKPVALSSLLERDGKFSQSRNSASIICPACTDWEMFKSLSSFIRDVGSSGLVSMSDSCSHGNDCWRKTRTLSYTDLIWGKWWEVDAKMIWSFL